MQIWHIGGVFSGVCGKCWKNTDEAFADWCSGVVADAAQRLQYLGVFGIYWILQAFYLQLFQNYSIFYRFF